MSAPTQIFQNYNLTATIADQGRAISFTQNWIGVLLQVTSVTGADALAQYRVQWSNDASVWFDAAPQDVIGNVTGPGTYIFSTPIKAAYWRVGAVVTGTTPSFICSATVLV